MKNIKADIIFLPVGGTYTMNWKEAAEAANTISCSYAIPIHYGDIVGSKNDAQNFVCVGHHVGEHKQNNGNSND